MTEKAAVISKKAQTTAARYFGQKAQNYEANRQGQSKWNGEDKAVRQLLSSLPPGSKILDIPCGTGRFYPLYKRLNFPSLGIDISDEMLAQARQKGMYCSVGDIFALPLADNSFDVALVIRFCNLIEKQDLKLALAELQRVAKSKIALTLRTAKHSRSEHYHSAYPVSVVENALQPGWKLAQDIRIHQDSYRLLVLENT